MGCLCEFLRRICQLQRLNEDQQVAIVIIQEAGGSITSRSLLISEGLHADPFALTPEVLMGREFLVIRAISAMQGETGREAQFVVDELYIACLSFADHNGLNTAGGKT